MDGTLFMDGYFDGLTFLWIRVKVLLLLSKSEGSEMVQGMV